MTQKETAFASATNTEKLQVICWPASHRAHDGHITSTGLYRPMNSQLHNAGGALQNWLRVVDQTVIAEHAGGAFQTDLNDPAALSRIIASIGRGASPAIRNRLGYLCWRQ
jgi:hypothetical protein